MTTTQQSEAASRVRKVACRCITQMTLGICRKGRAVVMSFPGLPDRQRTMLYVLTFGGDPITIESLPAAEAEPAQTELDAWWRAQRRAGRIRGCARLMGTFSATTAWFSVDRSLISDGAVALETDAVGAFGVIEAANLEEVVAIAQTWPLGGYVESRPLGGPTEVGDPGDYPQPMAQRGKAA